MCNLKKNYCKFTGTFWEVEKWTNAVFTIDISPWLHSTFSIGLNMPSITLQTANRVSHFDGIVFRNRFKTARGSPIAMRNKIKSKHQTRTNDEVEKKKRKKKRGKKKRNNFKKQKKPIVIFQSSHHADAHIIGNLKLYLLFLWNLSDKLIDIAVEKGSIREC